MLKKAFENIVRNWIAVIPAACMIAITLTLFFGLIITQKNATQTLQRIQEKFSITIYLKDSADPFETGNLITALEERTEIVKPVIYTSKEEAWERMSKTFSLDPELAKRYQFTLPASLTITPRTPQDVAIIEAFLKTTAASLLRDPSLSQAKQKTTTEKMIEFLQQLRGTVVRTLILLSVLFVIGGAMLISVTLHLAITSRHREISIMKLVGASHKTIAMPFVLEGVLIGILAFLLHFIVLFLLPFWEIASRFAFNLLLIEFAALLLITIAASYLTVYLHIRKKFF